MDRFIRCMVIMILIFTLSFSMVVPASATSSFAPDIIDVCASILAASGVTFKTTADYRTAGQRFWDSVQDDDSVVSDLQSILSSYVEYQRKPFKVTDRILTKLKTTLTNWIVDNKPEINIGAKYYKSLDYLAAIRKQGISALLRDYSECTWKASNLRVSSYADTPVSNLSTECKLRGWWLAHGSLIGAYGDVRFYASLYRSEKGYSLIYSFFCAEDWLNGYLTVSRYPASSPTDFNFNLSFVPYPYDTSNFVYYYLRTKDSDDSFVAMENSAHVVSDSSFVPYGHAHDHVPWTNVPTVTLPYDNSYADGSSGITIGTLIYMPEYTEITNNELTTPITPDSVRDDSGAVDPDPDPKPDPEPDPGEDEPVINKIYNFIVPILGDIKAGLDNLIKGVADIPAKISAGLKDLFGGLGDDLAGIAAFLPTLLGILTGYTLFITLFGHFLPDPVATTVYAFFIATIVIYLIRWVANR